MGSEMCIRDSKCFARGACGAPRAKHLVRSGLREGGGGGGRARPPQRVRSVSRNGFDSAVRRASQPRFAQRVRSCSLKNGFWSLRPLLRQFTRSVARLASLEGVNEPFAHATGSKLLRVFARGSSVWVLARSRGESTLRRSIVLGLSRPVAFFCVIGPCGLPSSVRGAAASGRAGPTAQLQNVCPPPFYLVTARL